MTTGDSSVEILGERVVPDRLTTQPLRLRAVESAAPSSPPPQTAPKPSTPPPSRKDSILLGVFQAIARILAVRFLLLLSLTGAFVLALGAMERQSWTGLAIMATYCLLTLIPLVWIEVSRGQMAK